MFKESSFDLAEPVLIRPPSGKKRRPEFRERETSPPPLQAKSERHVLHSRLRNILREKAWEALDEYDDY